MSTDGNWDGRQYCTGSQYCTVLYRLSGLYPRIPKTCHNPAVCCDLYLVIYAIPAHKMPSAALKNYPLGCSCRKELSRGYWLFRWVDAVTCEAPRNLCKYKMKMPGNAPRLDTCSSLKSMVLVFPCVGKTENLCLTPFEACLHVIKSLLQINILDISLALPLSFLKKQA